MLLALFDFGREEGKALVCRYAGNRGDRSEPLVPHVLAQFVLDLVDVVEGRLRRLQQQRIHPGREYVRARMPELGGEAPSLPVPLPRFEGGIPCAALDEVLPRVHEIHEALADGPVDVVLPRTPVRQAP